MYVCMYVCMCSLIVEVEGDASNVMGEVMQVDDGDDEEEEESNQGLKRKREDDQLLESMVANMYMYVCMYLESSI